MKARILVLLEDDFGQAVFLHPETEKPVFDSRYEALAAARDELQGLEPSRIWASLFELVYLETIRPEK